MNPDVLDSCAGFFETVLYSTGVMMGSLPLVCWLSLNRCTGSSVLGRDLGPGPEVARLRGTLGVPFAGVSGRVGAQH